MSKDGIGSFDSLDNNNNDKKLKYDYGDDDKSILYVNG